MSGKFQLSREIFEHPIWQNQAEFRLFIYLIGKAMHSEGVIIGDIQLRKGQYIRSYRKLREDLMYIENNTLKYYGLGTIKRLVDKLVRDGRIDILETELGTLFTVTNYTQYQGFSQVMNGSLKQQRNTNGTATEHQRNNNKNGINVINDNKEDIYIEIFDNWILQDIIKHKSITANIKKAMNKALKEHSLEIIIGAIKIYGEAYHSKYYYNYKHNLEDFLKQSNGVGDWIQEGTKYENYIEYKEGGSGKSNTNTGKIKEYDDIAKRAGVQSF